MATSMTASSRATSAAPAPGSPAAAAALRRLGDSLKQVTQPLRAARARPFTSCAAMRRARGGRTGSASDEEVLWLLLPGALSNLRKHGALWMARAGEHPGRAAPTAVPMHAVQQYAACAHARSSPHQADHWPCCERAVFRTQVFSPLVADEQHRARGAEGQARERRMRGHALLAHWRARVTRQVPHAHLPEAAPATGIGFLGHRLPGGAGGVGGHCLTL